MSSQRLPGKVLKDVAGKPLLGYLLDRLERCQALDGVVVATSRDAGDDAIEVFCIAHGTPVYRGELDDVAQRYCHVLDACPAAAFVRINGDSPLLDSRLIDEAVARFRAERCDLVTNLRPRSFPKGQSVEVLSTPVYRQVVEKLVDSRDREHLTRYYYRHADQFRIFNIAAPEDYSGVQMSVDTAEDFSAFARIIASMTRPHIDYGWQDILGLMSRVPIQPDTTR